MEAPSVLIVEDSPSFSRLLTRGLEREGYQVDVAPDIASAQLYLAGNLYSILLVDKGLPDGNGVEFIFLLRQKGVITPCIALAEPDFSEEQSPELEEHIEAFIPKPFAFDDLVSRMETLVREFRVQQDKTGATLQNLPVFQDNPTVTLTKARKRTKVSAVNVTPIERNQLDLPSNLFRAIPADEKLGSLAEKIAAAPPEPSPAQSSVTVRVPALYEPSQEEVVGIFRDLLDQPVDHASGRQLAPSKSTPLMVASFASVDEKEVFALCFMDVALANTAVGAMALLPPDEITENIATGEVPEELFIYLKEIFRVLSTLLNKVEDPEVRLHHLYRATGLLPHEDAVLIEEHAHRLDLSLSVEGFPDGQFSLLLG